MQGKHRKAVVSANLFALFNGAFVKEDQKSYLGSEKEVISLDPRQLLQTPWDTLQRQMIFMGIGEKLPEFMSECRTYPHSSSIF